MYNRYIPQPDGSFHRSRVEDKIDLTEQKNISPDIPPEILIEEPTVDKTQTNPKNTRSFPNQTGWNRRKPAASQRPYQTREQNSGNVLNFFRQLMPQNFDTEDLIIVLLLLLLSGDAKDEQNTALLTLVIYLFL